MTIRFLKFGGVFTLTLLGGAAACSNDSESTNDSESSGNESVGGAGGEINDGSTDTMDGGEDPTDGTGGAGNAGNPDPMKPGSQADAGDQMPKPDAGPPDAVEGMPDAGVPEPKPPTTGCAFPADAEIANADVPDGFCAWEWATNLGQPRGIITDANGDVLVVTRDSNTITLLYDDDEDGVSGADERVTLVSQGGLNHGIALHGDYLYASSSTTVYRWTYPGDRQPLGASETVISGIAGGGHSTRTLLFDDDYLYVSVGSRGNVDDDSSRSRLNRFPLVRLGAGGLNFNDDGEVFADGLRNEVGLALDSQGRVWGVENGVDRLARADLGGDIHEDNPAEELNLFAQAGDFYGYPYCFSEFKLAAGDGAGTQWAHPQFINDGTHSDAWCKDPANVVPPALAFQAHSAPLDLLFYPGGSFPDSYNGSILITQHGSWNRDEPTGYKVIRVATDANGMPSGEPAPLLEYGGNGDIAADWPHRPVALTVMDNGVLLISSDASGTVIGMSYEAP